MDYDEISTTMFIYNAHFNINFLLKYSVTLFQNYFFT